MQSAREILDEIFRDGTPESPVDIRWQNERMKEIIREMAEAQDV